MQQKQEMNDEGESYAREANSFFGKKKQTENQSQIEEALRTFIEKVKRLQKEKLELVREIEELGEQVEKEAQKLESEVSTLKKQVTTLNEVLRDVRTRGKQS